MYVRDTVGVRDVGHVIPEARVPLGRLVCKEVQITLTLQNFSSIQNCIVS